MATATTAAPLQVRDNTGLLDVELNLDFFTHTPQQVIEHLLKEEHIMPTTPKGESLTYKLAYEGCELQPDEPLGSQGVKPGATVNLLSINTKG